MTQPHDPKTPITMAHGSGGRQMNKLIRDVFVSAFDNQWIRRGDDGAVISVDNAQHLVMSTDSFVISPLFFPGGNIGSLAVHGTANDLAMMGAIPQYLSCSFIIEEGLLLDNLIKIVSSMAKEAKEAGISIVTGDTKVVEKGKGDGIFINTTGIGYYRNPGLAHTLSSQNVRIGDQIIINGTLGDHGIAIMSKRENLSFATTIKSDSVCLHPLVQNMLEVAPDIHCFRDATRGGVAAVLHEIASASAVGIRIYENQLPISPGVESACELLGIDPLNVANEGKLLAFCPPSQAQQVLKCVKSHPLGKNAAIIGEVRADPNHLVEMELVYGGHRLVQWLNGEQLPRIC